MGTRLPSRLVAALLVCVFVVGLLPASALSAPAAQESDPDAGQPAVVVEPSLRRDDPAPSGLVPASGRQFAATEQEEKNPKLQGVLADAAAAARRGGNVAGARAARERTADAADVLDAESGQIVVVVESDPSDRAAVRAAIGAAGGTIEAESTDLVQARAPVSALDALANDPHVRYVRLPKRPASMAVAGEGVRASGADVWHAASSTGAGAKVAIVDMSFKGLEARKEAGDVPTAATLVDYCGGNATTAGDGHGTAVAEVVYEMAPGAEQHLICVDSEVTLSSAKDYAIANNIPIVSASIGYWQSGRGDGTGPAGSAATTVAEARDRGILWVNAAGNEQQKHWHGTWQDADSDNFHDFAPGDNRLLVALNPNVSICAYLQWDAWPTTNQDFDLYALRPGTNEYLLRSIDAQTGTQAPIETICLANTGTTQSSVELVIVRKNASSTPRLDLFFRSLSGSGTYEYRTANGSLIEPATSPDVLTVGAICWETNRLESYSSLGPTIDGRVKPDVAGQTGVSSATYGNWSSCGASSNAVGGFNGTSGATPHVSAAAALVKGANPDFTAEQIEQFLISRAQDLGAAGKDNLTGWGRLQLGSVPVGTVDLELVSLAGPSGAVRVGENATYSIGVRNTSTTRAASAVSVNLGDAIRDAERVSSTCPGSGPHGTCENFGIPPGETVAFTYVVRHRTMGSKTITASVSALQNDTNPGNNAKTITTTVTSAASADLEVTSLTATTPSGAFTASQDVTYRATVRNNGPDEATGVRVSFGSTVAGATFVSSNCSTQGGTRGSGTCSGLSLTSAQVATIDYVVRYPTTGTKNVTATASAREVDPNTGNNSKSVTSTVNLPTADLALLSLSKQAGSNTTGQNVTYQVALKNNGPDRATNALVDFGPALADAAFVSSTCPAAGGTVSGSTACRGMSIASGDTVFIDWTIQYTTSGEKKVEAAAAADQLDSSPGNNSKPLTDTIGSPPTANLVVDAFSQDPATPVFPGQDVTYAITIRNAGPDVATNVTVSFGPEVAAGEYRADTCPGVPPQVNQDTATCSNMFVNPTRTLSIVYVVRYQTAGSRSVTATVRSNEIDPTTTNNSRAVTTDVVVPTEADLTLEVADTPDPVAVGQELTYRATVSNAGPAEVIDAMIDLGHNALQNATFVSSTCPGTLNGTVCSGVVVSAGGSVAFDFVVRPTTAGARTTSALTFSTREPSGNVTPANVAHVTTTVDPPPSDVANLALTVQDGPDPLTVNGELTYAVTVANAGPGDATGVSVDLGSGALPNAQVVSSTCPGTRTGAVCSGFGVPAGQTRSFQVVVRPTVAGTRTTTATVSAAQQDPSPATNSVQLETTVNQAASADLSVTIADAPDPATTGQDLTYTVTVANAGPSDATNVRADVGEGAAQDAEEVSSTCPGTLDRTVCRGMSVPANQSRSFQLVVRPTVAGARTTTASVAADQVDPQPGNNAAPTTTTVQQGATVPAGRQPPVCQPRPRIAVQARPSGDGRLEVTVAATGLNNALQSVRFGTDTRGPSNAVVDVVDGPRGARDGFLHPVAPGVERVTFHVRRATAGQATTVPLVVTDGCGAWETFVGGGTGAGF